MCDSALFDDRPTRPNRLSLLNKQEMARQLTCKVGEIEESVEEQIGSLTETFKGEFGEGINKV